MSNETMKSRAEVKDAKSEDLAQSDALKEAKIKELINNAGKEPDAIIRDEALTAINNDKAAEKYVALSPDDRTRFIEALKIYAQSSNEAIKAKASKALDSLKGLI